MRREVGRAFLPAALRACCAAGSAKANANATSGNAGNNPGNNPAAGSYSTPDFAVEEASKGWGLELLKHVGETSVEAAMKAIKLQLADVNIVSPARTI